MKLFAKDNIEEKTTEKEPVVETPKAEEAKTADVVKETLDRATKLLLDNKLEDIDKRLTEVEKKPTPQPVEKAKTVARPSGQRKPLTELNYATHMHFIMWNNSVADNPTKLK